jgi:hypothetical protein
MSHFSVAIFTEPGGKTIEELLAPFHEFECTGTVDQYVQSIDQLAEVREEYEKDTTTKLKAPDGTLFGPWEDRFYRDPTEEELKKIGPIAGSGCGGGLIWQSRDWNDGRGYRAKVRFIPEGFEEVELKTADIMPFRDYIERQYERKVLFEGEEPDIHDKHKWGWMRVNSKGEVIELIDRTNPNKQWDWWVVGGRYNGKILVKRDAGGKTGELGAFRYAHEKESPAPEGYMWVDSAKIKDICWDMMAEISRKEREKYWEEAQDKDSPERYFSYGIKKDMTREEYLKDAGTFTTFAVITPDGKWHEKGEMGWWACVSNEKEGWAENYYDAFLRNADPEWTITIVDCHI